jgi:hypothetical protein
MPQLATPLRVPDPAMPAGFGRRCPTQRVPLFMFPTQLPMFCHVSCHNSPQGEARRERRMVDRCPVDEAAVVRQPAARNQTRPDALPATIVDVSSRGAALCVPLEFDLVPNRIIEIGIDGAWTRARVVWSRLGLDGRRIGGVEFAEAFPSFLPALATWPDRHEAISR